MPSRPALLIIALLLLSCAFHASGYQSLGDVFQQQLANLTRTPSTGKSPYLGGGDLHHCCLLAVNDSLQITDGNLRYVPGQTILHGSVESLEAHQFPCDSVYNGSASSLDEPQVTITYDWCHSNCPGWQVSSSADLGEWARPLISYITPSAIFVLNIPRRREIRLPPSLIPRNLISLSDILSLVYKIPLASAIVTLDTIFWLITVFALSGPLMLSGIYEALLDNRILRYLDSRMNVNSMSVIERAQLLAVTLLGNLDFHPAWADMEKMTAGLSAENMRRRSSTFPSSSSPLDGTGSARLTVSFPYLGGPKWVNAGSSSNSNESENASRAPVLTSDKSTQPLVENVKLKLKSMMASQISFSNAIGAALVFYMGSFVYTLVESEGNIGDSWTAHNIGFGMFWMVVPHVAVISSLLLAGNNPNVWQAISASNQTVEFTSELSPKTKPRASASAQQEDSVQANEKRAITSLRSLVKMLPRFHVSADIYDTKYKPAWLWDRGTCKAMWVSAYVDKHPHLASIEKEVLHMGLDGWVLYTSAPALILVILPTFLGGLISYTTPAVGLSCRSLTMLLYAGAQTWLIFLWLCDWRFWKRDEIGKVRVSPKRSDRPIWMNVLWYISFAFGILMAVFTGIFGTVFLLLGLYRNCLCLLPIQYWNNRHTVLTTTSMGNVDRHNFALAKQFWMPCGLSATIFLVSVTYIGWWYQRQLRARFLNLVEHIDAINEDDARENA